MAAVTSRENQEYRLILNNKQIRWLALRACRLVLTASECVDCLNSLLGLREIRAKGNEQAIWKVGL